MCTVTTDFTGIGQRIQGIREASDVSVAELASELGVSPETLEGWEATGADVPISAIFHLASKFGVDMTEILTGNPARLDTYQIVRKKEGQVVDRLPGYHFQDLAWKFTNKVMQPLMVTLDPGDEVAALVTHEGQEFNLVLEGDVAIRFGEKEFVLGPGDSVFFDPSIPHGQRCAGDVPAVFVTVLAE